MIPERNRHRGSSPDLLNFCSGDPAKVVELRFLGGLSAEETSEVLGLSPTTVKREWATARLWLFRAINEQSP
jgi:DNA-directed RNA polymerase specialized sigma24 family protein